MIQITFVTIHGHFHSLEVKGHAESGPYGSDIVCSAVSGVTMGLNALQDDPATTYKSKNEPGNVYLEAIKEVSEHDAIVLETLEKQYESIAALSPKYVKLERKQK
jgi:hypothetical protein